MNERQSCHGAHGMGEKKTPADATRPWRAESDASAPPVAAPPGDGVGRPRLAIAEECADFYLQEVVNHNQYL